MPEPIVSFTDIDWLRPWLAPFSETGQSLISGGDWLRAANQIAHQQKISTASGLPVTFIPQRSLPADIGYEAHIHATGQVPTRDNLHDFFNALVWLHFPRMKKTLNALHAASQSAESVAHHAVDEKTVGSRGRARDAATLFDENAALFICSDVQAAEYLRQHQWQPLLQQTPDKFFSTIDIVLFGHALMEKLIQPYKAITAHVWITMVEPHWFALSDGQRMDHLDTQVAAAISQGFSSRDFAHLPVLGVPGWWPGQDRHFYNDPAVFRSLRHPPQSR